MTILERLLSGSVLGTALPAVEGASLPRSVAQVRAAYLGMYSGTPTWLGSDGMRYEWKHSHDTRVRPSHVSMYKKSPQLLFYTLATELRYRQPRFAADWEQRMVAAAREVGATIEGDSMSFDGMQRDQVSRMFWKMRNHALNYGYTVRSFGDVQ